MRFISRIIFLFAVLMPFCGMAGPDFSVHFARLGDQSPETEQFLRELHNGFQQVYRLRGNNRSNRACKIVITGAVPPGEIQITPKPDHWLIEFDNSLPGWQQNRKFLSRLMGIFFAAKYTRVNSVQEDFFPRWITAGILHRLESRKSTAQLVRRNQDYAISRALIAGGRPLPDFRQLTVLPPELTDQKNIVQVWFDEFSRLLLENCISCTTPEQNPMRNYTAALMQTGKNREIIFEQHFAAPFLAKAAKSPLPEQTGLDKWNYLPPPVKVQKYLEYMVYKICFNNYFPQPVRELHKQFAAFRKLSLTKPDAAPGTPPETFDMENYPDLLKNHPNAPATLIRKINELRTTAEGGDIEFRETLQKLSLAMQKMQKDPSDPPWRAIREYRQIFPQVPAVLERRLKIEKYLEKTEEEFRSPALFYQDAIRESMLRQPGETPRITELLDQTEKKFYGTF